MMIAGHKGCVSDSTPFHCYCISRGLHSSLEMEDALRNFWYPAEFSKVGMTAPLAGGASYYCITALQGTFFSSHGLPWLLAVNAEGLCCSMPNR